MSIKRSVNNDIFTVAPNINNNAKLLLSLLHETVHEAAPDYILPIIKQGVSDGSIKAEYPEQLAELIILVANVWINPMIFNNTKEEIYGKYMIFRQMMQGFGLDIMDDEILDRIMELVSIYEEKK